jgi:parvulin-like peptidyl-prolyl isomerase
MLNLYETLMKHLLLLSVLSAGAMFAQAPSVVPGSAPVGDDAVVAKVDSHEVTAREIREALANMPPEFQQLYQRNPQYAVQQLFVMRHLSTEAEKEKLDQQSPLKEQLAASRANILATAMLNHERDYYRVPDGDIEENYKRNLTRYQQARIKVISIAFKPSAAGNTAGQSLEEIARAATQAAVTGQQRSEADAKKLAEDLVKQIRGGADFAKLVAQYSDDADSKAKGGDFGAVNFNSAYSDEIKKAVFALKAGEVTDPLRQAGAFYVIRVEERNVQTLREVTEPIMQELRQAHLQQWFQDLNKRYEIKVENLQFFTQSAGAK